MKKNRRSLSIKTGNNSGVIHSGIYYRPGSLKAKNCLEGYGQLLAFCDEHKINYNLCGKIIVAKNESELDELQMIYDRGKAKGMEQLRIIDQKSIKSIEPHIEGIKAIHVPQAGNY